MTEVGGHVRLVIPKKGEALGERDGHSQFPSPVAPVLRPRHEDSQGSHSTWLWDKPHRDRHSAPTDSSRKGTAGGGSVCKIWGQTAHTALPAGFPAQRAQPGGPDSGSQPFPPPILRPGAALEQVTPNHEGKSKTGKTQRGRGEGRRRRRPRRQHVSRRQFLSVKNYCCRILLEDPLPARGTFLCIVMCL